jgi:hypothetical protein
MASLSLMPAKKVVGGVRRRNETPEQFDARVNGYKAYNSNMQSGMDSVNNTGITDYQNNQFDQNSQFDQNNQENIDQVFTQPSYRQDFVFNSQPQPFGRSKRFAGGVRKQSETPEQFQQRMQQGQFNSF